MSAQNPTPDVEVRRSRRRRRTVSAYRDGDRIVVRIPASMSWVTNQNARWGSCTPGDRTIRLSDRLQQMPGWVVDYVLVHELAHLLEAGHTPEFWAWVDRYPKAEKAKGYLEGFSTGARLEPPPGVG